MSGPIHYSQLGQPPKKPWYKHPLAIFGAGVAVLLLLCCVGGTIATALAGKDGASTPGSLPTDQPVATQTTASQAPVVQPTTVAPVVAPTPVTVKGTGTKVTDAGVVLNGTYRVDYQANGQFFIAEFLTASGETGSGFMETINEYSNGGSVAGSTVVHLKNVSIIKTSNTRSNWTLVFTPLS